MALLDQTLEYFRGDSVPLRLTCIDEDTLGAANLTGILDAWFLLKAQESDPDSAALLNYRLGVDITVASSSGGLLDVNLRSTDTAALEGRTYYFTAGIRLPGGICTVAKGFITFPASVPVSL